MDRVNVVCHRPGQLVLAQDILACLVLCPSSPWGERGSFRDQHGFGIRAQGVTWLTHRTGRRLPADRWSLGEAVPRIRTYLETKGRRCAGASSSIRTESWKPMRFTITASNAARTSCSANCKPPSAYATERGKSVRRIGNRASEPTAQSGFGRKDL